MKLPIVTKDKKVFYYLVMQCALVLPGSGHRGRPALEPPAPLAEAPNLDVQNLKDLRRRQTVVVEGLALARVPVQQILVEPEREVASPAHSNAVVRAKHEKVVPLFL
mmetsp:Transcript_12740/g.26912  ORF Transcript_12740/g.26912 Transcript_12740/m.26912 type:complete len:107 (-) Transcript_12740:1227-1547(-)